MPDHPPAMTLFATVLAFVLALPGATPAEALNAREIMQRVDDRDDGDNSTMDMDMLLIDKRGKQRVRQLRSYGKDIGPDTVSLMFFRSPADVKDTGFLTYDYDEPARDDDQWLYLPALKKTKRIASSDKSGSFMGSDMSYADFSSISLELYDFELMKETEIGGHAVWQIEQTARSEAEMERTGYSRSVVWVRKDNFVVVRSLNWLRRGGKLKYVDIKKLEQIDGIWTATEIHATTRQGKQTLHKTVLRFLNVRFDQDLEADFFSIRRLEKGL